MMEVKLSFGATAYMKEPEKVVIDTPYGEGVVMRVRDDGMMEVKLSFGATAYMKEPEKAPEKSQASEEPHVEEDMERINTQYGEGFVITRRDDGMMEVQLKFGVAYMRQPE